MFYPWNPVFTRCLDPSVLAFSLSSHGHPSICILIISRFTSYNKDRAHVSYSIYTETTLLDKEWLLTGQKTHQKTLGGVCLSLRHGTRPPQKKLDQVYHSNWWENDERTNTRFEWITWSKCPWSTFFQYFSVNFFPFEPWSRRSLRTMNTQHVTLRYRVGGIVRRVLVTF